MIYQLMFISTTSTDLITSDIMITAPPKVMSDISMLTLLLRASTVIKNRNGDPSIHGYAESEMKDSETSNTKSASSDDFVLLNCLSDILVQDKQTLAASYNDATCFTLVIPSSDSESDSKLDFQHDPDSFDVDLLPDHTVSSTTSIRSIDAAVIPNPEYCGVERQSSGLLGEIQEIESGENLWIACDPLHKVLQ
jgi:hypothetical protein